MKSRFILLMGILLVLMTALGHFVSCAVVQGQHADTNDGKASWQTIRQIFQTDACPEGRHLDRGSSVSEGGQGRRWTTGSFTLVCNGSTLPHELLTTSEQRLRQQSVGLQTPLQVLQCSWLI